MTNEGRREKRSLPPASIRMAQMTETVHLTGLAETPNPCDCQDPDLRPDTSPLTPNGESVTFRPSRISWRCRPEFYMSPMTLEEYDREYCRQRGFPFWPESDNPVRREAMTTATSDSDCAELRDAANTGPNHDANRLSDTNPSETSGRMRRWIRDEDHCPPSPEVCAPPESSRPETVRQKRQTVRDRPMSAQISQREQRRCCKNRRIEPLEVTCLWLIAQASPVENEKLESKWPESMTNAAPVTAYYCRTCKYKLVQTRHQRRPASAEPSRMQQR
jgi:hypothetical protein